MSAADDLLQRDLQMLNAPLPKPKNEMRVDTTKLMPSGRIAREFLLSDAPVSCLMGPLGSGKTTVGCAKGLGCSLVVPQSPIDGVRYARGVVLRDTYLRLQENTIKTWHIKFKKEFGEWRGGANGEPAKARILWRLDDGTLLDMEVLFAALGTHNVKEFCDGFEVNWAFINGLDAMPADLLTFLRPRLGRWPPPEHRPANWRDFEVHHRKAWGDMNAPDEDNWTHGKMPEGAEPGKRGFVENVPKGWKLFVQPGGLDIDASGKRIAENLENLPGEYYEEMVESNPDKPWFVDRMVHNKFGFSRDGTPVYPEYNDAIHYSKVPLIFEPKNKLGLGFDAGRDPRCVAGQKNFMGQMKILRQFIPPRRMAAEEFGKLCSEWLAREFPNAERIEAWADPAAANPNDISDRFWIDVVSSKIGVKIKPAPTNDIDPRLESVKVLLNGNSGGQPLYQLDPSCQSLRKGKQSKYRFAAITTHGDGVEGGIPVKNNWSHDQDAEQYLCLGMSDWQSLRGRKKRRAAGHHPDDVSRDPHDY